MMNTGETVRRSLKRLTLFISKLLNSMLLPPWSPPSQSSSEGDNENEYGIISWSLAAQTNNNGPPCQTVLLMMSNQRRRNSYSENRFYQGRRVPCAVLFYNVNIFNFSQESFSSNLIFAPLIPILLSFLQSSGTNPSPFELHPTAFMVSVGCSVAYYLALAAKFMFSCFASQFGALMSVFGSVAVATLISLTLQLPWWSIVFIILLMGGFFKLLHKLHATYGSIRRPQPRTMQPLLPLFNVTFNHWRQATGEASD